MTNPNAPTGVFAPVDVVAKAARRFKGVFVVDEAYADFSGTNCVMLNKTTFAVHRTLPPFA